MALTDKLTDIADAIREAGGTTAKLTPAEMPAAIEKLGEDAEYPTLVMYQGQPFTLVADLAKADGAAWEMPSSDTLALHMWHGADTLDASGSTTTLSVDVPADAVLKTWHWTLVLTHGGTDYMVALGDAECRAEGTAKERHVGGVVDKARKAQTAMNRQYVSDFWLNARTSTKVGGYAFQGNTVRHARCQKVTLVESDNAFWGCESLRSVELPACTSVGGSAFNGCASLTSVELPACTSVSGSAFNGCASLTSVELPACTSVSGYAFYNCTSLTSVELPACTSLGNYVFNGCYSLESVELPACTSVGGYALRLSGLRSVELPACKTVASSGFDTCMSLRKASLPACTSIGANAFYQCGTLSVVLLPGETMCTLTGSNAFGRTAIVRDGCGYIYVNDDLVDDYKAATNWSAYANYIKPISEWDGTIPDLPDSTGWDD